jgi:membrane-associated protease RseP (regulator of RpoE activity)
MAQSVPAVPSFVERRPYKSRSAVRPTPVEWVRHSALFALTIVTTTFAGTLLIAPSAQGFSVAEPASALGYLKYIPLLYLSEIVGVIHQIAIQPSILNSGLAFSASLLAILTAHESGHYVACRLYDVDATLPFFIPAPPMVLAGTFGAFIKIKSPIPTRRALFDIGVAGPIAGFVVAVPVLLLGMLTAQQVASGGVSDGGTIIYFHDSLLAHLAAKLVGANLATSVAPNPYYFASWIGLLVTSLNLMPVGQLDGGHAVYAVFGFRAHWWISRIAFVSMIALAISGWVWHGSPSGFVYALLLAIVLRMPHPQPVNEYQRLDRGRLLVALGVLAIFVLTFLPFPISVQ